MPFLSSFSSSLTLLLLASQDVGGVERSVEKSDFR